MTWSATYCTDGTSDLARAKVETESELREWVALIEAERGISKSIFDEKQYINTRYSKQWGTDYWWLTVVGKTDSEGGQDEVQVGGRPVSARVLDRRGTSDSDQDRGQGQAPVPEGGAQSANSRCPTCGQEVTR